MRSPGRLAREVPSRALLGFGITRVSCFGISDYHGFARAEACSVLLASI